MVNPILVGWTLGTILVLLTCLAARWQFAYAARRRPVPRSYPVSSAWRRAA